MGSTTLFNAVFIRPEQVGRFLLCNYKSYKVLTSFNYNNMPTDTYVCLDRIGGILYLVLGFSAGGNGHE